MQDKNSRLSQSIDCVDSLIRLGDADHDLTKILIQCRHELAAISWERFRLRHEYLSKRAEANRRRAALKLRHTGGNHG